ncbi:MAG TPA: 30S ribosomal protein S17 [Candidatus Brocadiia bacterium]|nr:30S ribosomal protein S17 [Candidatus Brocadiia bacterium]
MSGERGNRRRVVGVVTSDKMAKTIVVESVRMTAHPKFGKYIKRVTKYRAHDENGEAHAGDRVELGECRRLSKTKAWRLLRVLEAQPRQERAGDGAVQ